MWVMDYDLMGAGHHLGTAFEAVRKLTLADTSSIDPFCHQFARCLQVPFKQHLDV